MTALADRLEAELDGSLRPWPSARSLVDALRGSKSDWEHIDEPVKLREAVYSLLDESTAGVSAEEAKTVANFFVDVFTHTPPRPSEPNLRAVTDALPVLVSYVTADERYGLVNRAYEEWFGVPRKDLIGKTILEVVGEADYATQSPNVKRGLAGESFTFEQLGIPYRLGGNRDVRVQFVPHADATGKNDGYVALLQDITAERAFANEREALLERAEAARADALAERARQHDLFMQAPVAIAILEGPTHVFTFANPAYRALVNGRDVVGHALLDALPDVKGQGFDTLLDHVMATGETYAGKEVPVRLDHHRPDDVLMLDFVYTPKRDSAGNIDGVLMTGWDVTEPVRTRQRVDELRRVAESANRSKDEFLAMLGHELRNPLAPISTALELMKLEGTSAFKMEREIIERQVDHLTRLVDDLLDISRITSGKTEMERKRVEIADVVARAIEIATPLIAKRSHHVNVSLAEGLAVDGDPLRLAQIISNLLTNAAKYTEPGGHIEVTAARDGDLVTLSVRDDGIGIAPEMIERVFDLFTQAQQSIERARGGLGLGLSIVRSLVAQHGGSVRAESKGRGQGSLFTVTLPPSTDSSPPLSRGHVQREILAARGESRRVLIVDDNIDAAELLSIALERRGHETRVTHDGPSALELLDSFTPDVAVLDIGLPVMDGYALAQRLRVIPRLASTRLIALTGYGQAKDRQRSSDAGFVAHLVKPVRFEELDSLLNDEPS
jgi:PAS domain S-box-containing protein